MNLPLTDYICALIEVQMGRTTMDAVRARWKAGEFKGVRDDWAKAYADLHRSTA